MNTLGIDASNLLAGGGITHLVELLRVADPVAHGFSQVVVWASQATLSKLEERPWLIKRHEPALERSWFLRALWQRNRLGVLATKEGCDLLFVPGGSFVTKFRPIVTMCRNMLPFVWREMFRFGVSLTTLRYIMLRLTQSRSFKNANGTIFLTEYARSSVLGITGKLEGKTTVIPHGINRRFFSEPRMQRPIEDCSCNNPFRVVYVSIINFYKHQWNVTDAVARLRAGGLPITLDLIGPAYPPAMARLWKSLRDVDPEQCFIRYLGSVPYDELNAKYLESELFVFASSCENMPNILLEGMAAGLPIASSNCEPMPEVLGDAGVYFDPESPLSIAESIEKLIESPLIRLKISKVAYERAKVYSWHRCAEETFGFLRGIIDGKTETAVIRSQRYR